MIIKLMQIYLRQKILPPTILCFNKKFENFYDICLFRAKIFVEPRKVCLHFCMKGFWRSNLYKNRYKMRIILKNYLFVR